MNAGSNLAYIILAHKLPDQLVRLIDRLDTPSASFFVHVDLNARQATFDRIVDRLGSRPNVHFVHRFACSWGSWNLVAATLEGLGQVFRRGISPGHVVLLSGQDYPLKRAEEIEAFLGEHQGVSFLLHRSFPDFTWGSYGWNIDGGMPRLKDQTPAAGFDLFWGSQWWALSGDCAAHLKSRAEGSELSRFLEKVAIPDEMFFQTLALNSPFRDTLEQSLLKPNTPPRASDFVAGLHYIDWIRGQPKILGVEDYERLIASGAFFARKFDLTRDRTIIDLIDVHLGISPHMSRAAAPSIVTTAPTLPSGTERSSGVAASRPDDEQNSPTMPSDPITSANVIVPHVINLVQPRSVIAVGCGAGGWLAAFQEHGIKDVLGIVGDGAQGGQLPIRHDQVTRHDLTLPLHIDRTFDCAVAMGTAEDLPACSATTLVASLVSLARIVLFSAASPGQGGAEPRNERWPSYWADLFAQHGYVTIDCIRPLVCAAPDVNSRYAWNVLLFVDRDYVDSSPSLRGLYLEHGGTPLPWIDANFWSGGPNSWAAELRRMRNAWTAQTDADVQDLAALLAASLARSREAKASRDERDAWKHQAKRLEKALAELRDRLCTQDTNTNTNTNTNTKKMQKHQKKQKRRERRPKSSR